MYYKIKQDGLYGFIDEKGKLVVKPEYELIFEYKFDICVVRKINKYGLLDAKGALVLPCQYEFIQSIAKDILTVSSDKGKALMDTSGKQLTEYKYGGIFEFSEGLAMAYKGLKFGYLNNKGEEVIPFEYDFAEGFREGYAMVSKNGKVFLINQKAAFNIEIIFDFYTLYPNGYIVNIGGKREDDEISGGKFGLLSKKNQLHTKLEFDFIDHFIHGRAIVQKDKLFGEINEEGEIVTPIINKEPVYKREDYSIFKKGNKYGLMDEEGKELIPALYDELVPYPALRLCWAKENNLFGILNFDNNFIIKPSIDLLTIYSISDDHVHVELKNRKHGLLNIRNGSWLVPPEYDSIGVFKGSLVELERNGKQFYANRNGTIVWQE